jgi:CheY-like chemotaxis protein
MNVLVVDDSVDIRFMLRILLEDAGMDVEEADSGNACLARLADDDADRIDAVVLDQRMPEMTGLEVAQVLTARGSHPPLVLFSAYLHPVLQATAEELGVATVVKTELAELIAVLRNAAHGAAVA